MTSAEVVRPERPVVKRDADGRMVYEPDGLSLSAYVLDNSEIAVIRGPWGSGKTLGTCQRIWRHAVEQNFSTTGGKPKRRSRWFFLRESYPKIVTTTMQTWTEWFPERLFGKLFTGSRPYLHEVRVGDIELDLWFAAYDDTEAMFRSLEPTGVAHNELEYTPMKMFFSGHGRVGRFPRAIDGGSKWSGTIADTNAPPDNHWLPLLTGEASLPDDMSFDQREAYRVPQGMAYYVQPPALLEVKDAAGRVAGWRVNPEAENLKWLTDYDAEPPETIGGESYYRRARQGQTLRWIQANLCNKIVPQVAGAPVFTSYDETVHLAPEPLEPRPGQDVVLGLDFGRRPAAVFSQTLSGQRQYQFDAALENAGASKFAPLVREVLARHYPWILRGQGELRAWGDPKGQDGTQSDEQTAYDVFRSYGIIVRPAPVKLNNINTRIAAVEWRLERFAMGGKPAFLVSPKASRVRAALAGGYRYPEERPAPMTERKPIKDKYSDIADAVQYAELGEGAGREMIERAKPPRPVSTRPARRSYRRI